MINHSKTKELAVLGIPLDENSSFLRGPALAPAHIRKVFYDESWNLSTENGLDLSSDARFRDHGDLGTATNEPSFQEINWKIKEFLSTGAKVLTLGGDHSITYPIIQAYSEFYPDLYLIQLDAHPDLYDKLYENRHSHACPFARIMEEKLVNHLMQIGIRTLNPHQRKQAERFGVEIIEVRNWATRIPLTFPGPVYLSLDMDVLDPAFAPGISHHEPGGLSTRDVLEIIQNIETPIVGADIVELNPIRDINQMSSRVAAKFLKEISAKILTG